MNQHKIGYARVSTSDQMLEIQIEALKKAGCDSIYQEVASGKRSDRPELDRCKKALRKGDTLVVFGLDRLGRSLSDLVQIIADLDNRGIGFESLSENIDTKSASGKLQFHIFASLAEFERALIRERTISGLASARARGRVGGRKRKLCDKDLREIKVLLNDKNIPVSDIAKRFGVSRTTLYKHINQ